MTPVLLETIVSARRLTRLYNESDPSDAAARLTPKGCSWYTTLVAPVRIGARVWIGATVVLLTDRRVSE